MSEIRVVYVNGYNGTNYHPVRIDSSTRSIQVLEYSHHEIHSGSHYFVDGSATVNTGTNLDFLWVVPDTTAWPHALWEIDAEYEVTMSMYESVVTSADGSAVTIFNNNRNSANTAGVAAYTGPTLNSGALGDGSDGGNLVWQKVVGSGKKVGGDAGREHEFIGKQNTKYWFRISNTSGTNSWVNYDFNWYEHTDQAT